VDWEPTVQVGSDLVLTKKIGRWSVYAEYFEGAGVSLKTLTDVYNHVAGATGIVQAVTLPKVSCEGAVLAPSCMSECACHLF
jgi:hypothetical protein